MSTLPKILKNHVAYIDGFGYAGKAPELKLPQIKLKTTDYEAGGMAGPVEVDMGVIEKMEAEVTFAEYNVMAMKQLGNPNASVTFRGAQEGDTGEAEAVIVTMRGLFKEIDPGSWKPGDKSTVKFTVALKYLKVTVGSEEIYEIDCENMIRRIGGKDQMAGIRRALGL
ncbi:MAG: phage major tail tube protein [Magnetospirillum sp.]|nr:MAG: phage major tail tube protein [Magnetospirillum sp.]